MSQPLETVNPGKSRHSTCDALLLGVLSDPTSVILYIHSADGSTTTPAVTRDSTGVYHSDWVLPLTAKDGVWVRRWVATGASPSSTGFDEVKFIVPKLAY